MKTFSFYISIIVLLLSGNALGQTIGEKPYTILTEKNQFRFIITGIYEEEVDYPFSDTQRDTIEVNFFKDTLQVQVLTDVDTLITDMSQNEKIFLEVKKEKLLPLTIIINNGVEKEAIHFSNTKSDNKYRILYEEGRDNSYLKQLKSLYPIDSIASMGKTDMEKIRNITTWVHNLWEHDGENEPAVNNALSILEQVRKGERFRCVEYGIVTTACLNAIGIKSRVLSLKAKDIETRESGAGHVLVEAFVNDLNKWIMIDPQYDVIFHLNGVPLNAVEVQQAFTNEQSVEIWTSEEIPGNYYIPWLYPYLYYFSVKFDNRESIQNENKYTIEGKTDLMLVPIGAKEPTVFQINTPLNYCIYTHSLAEFYGKP